MIKEAYVGFEVAKLLKEKGFNEKTFTYFDDDLLCHGGWFEWNNSPMGQISAPTHQMAMAWLREIYHIIFVFKPSYFSGDECTYWSYERWCGDNFDGEVLSFKTYEDAVEAALKCVLENLI